MINKELFALVSPCLQFFLAPLQPNSKTVVVYAGVPYIGVGSGLFGIWIKTNCSSLSRRVVVSLLCAMHVTESILIPVHPTAPCTNYRSNGQLASL